MADLIKERAINLGECTPEVAIRKIGEKMKKDNTDSVFVDYAEKDYGKKHILMDVLVDGYKAVDIYEDKTRLEPDKDGRVKKMHRLKIKRKGVLND